MPSRPMIPTSAVSPFDIPRTTEMTLLIGNSTRSIGAPSSLTSSLFFSDTVAKDGSNALNARSGRLSKKRLPVARRARVASDIEILISAGHRRRRLSDILDEDQPGGL